VRVLVCDDNVDAADILGILLRAQGHDVKVVYDGLACVRAAMEWKPMVAFLDIGMPDVSGFDIAQQLRKHLGRAIRLVALTAYTGIECRQQASRAGFDVHLTKPAPFDRIVALAANPLPS
jgi:CheY-like chemotaxis protein